MPTSVFLFLIKNNKLSQSETQEVISLLG